MGRIQAVRFIDDLDGAVLEDSVEMVRWSLDGREYEFDTSPGNARAFRDAVARYVQISRRVTANAPGSGKRGVAPAAPRVIRQWARGNGVEVPDRGRVPAAVVDAFQAAR